MKIYKYVLEMVDLQEIEMPLGASILSAHNQDGQICIWAQVDETMPMETRQIEVVGTGNPMPEHGGKYREFIGTVIWPPLVFHIYEIRDALLSENHG